MIFVLQNDMFDTRYPHIYSLMEKLNLPYKSVRVFPFSNKVVELKDILESFDLDELQEFTPPDEPFMVFGSVKLSRIAYQKWHRGTYLNENHDYEIYSKFYKEELLNHDCDIVSFNHDSRNWKDEYMFIRPTLDSKLFNGKKFSKAEWNDFVQYNFKNFNKDINLNEQKVVVASLKEIEEEVRFFVFKGKVVTGSRYVFEGKFSPYKWYNDEAKEYAQKMVDLYQPAEAFVIDVCLTNKGWKIVEINCFNCAGYYECDLERILKCVA